MIFVVVVMVLAILERVGFPHGLVVAFVVAWLAKGEVGNKWIMVWGFGAGLIVDLVFLNGLGITGLLFLAVRVVFVLINSVVGDKFPWPVGVIAVAAAGLEAIIAGYPVVVWELVLTAVLAVGVYILLRSDRFGGDEIFLRKP